MYDDDNHNQSVTFWLHGKNFPEVFMNTLFLFKLAHCAGYCTSTIPINPIISTFGINNALL